MHRVQRVPETESGGRIHTSAATVAVLPEAEEVDVKINPGDLRIDIYRAGGHGGQGLSLIHIFPMRSTMAEMRFLTWFRCRMVCASIRIS